MKRFLILSAFALCGSLMTGGLSDSIVSKEVPAYQVFLPGDDLDTYVFHAFSEADSAPVFELSEPEFGRGFVAATQYDERSSEQVVSQNKSPPDNRSQKSEYNYRA